MKAISDESRGSVDAMLLKLPLLKEHPELMLPLTSVFSYTQFLLDNDENLTRTGNLNADARSLLQRRICEVFDIPAETEPNAEPKSSMASEVADDGGDTDDADEESA